MTPPAPPPFRPVERRPPARVVVLGPNAFSRSCMVAGLVGADGVEADACDDPAAHQSPPPDVVLLQEVDGLAGDWLPDHLRRARASWPDTPLVVMAGDMEAELPLCLDLGVHACLPAHATLEQVTAAVHLALADLVVYPARLLARRGQTHRWDDRLSGTR